MLKGAQDRLNDNAGRRDYEADVRRRPTYDDGTPRKTWEQLGELERWTWRMPRRGGWIVIKDRP